MTIFTESIPSVAVMTRRFFGWETTTAFSDTKRVNNLGPATTSFWGRACFNVLIDE